MSLSPPASPAPPLHLVVRFLALPDIHFEIADPDRFTTVRLKVLIRQELARAAQADAESHLTKAQQKQKAPAASSAQQQQHQHQLLLSPTNLSSSPTLQDAPRRRLRILYAGRNLADTTVLGHVLRPVAPPRASPSNANNTLRHDSLSIAPDSDAARSRSSSAAAAARVIVSCSISDVLPDSALAAEAEAAVLAEAAAERAALDSAGSFLKGVQRDIFQRRGGSTIGGTGGAGPSSVSVGTNTSAGPSTRPAPRGFQRLLQGGFSTAEVNQLRLQFNSIQAARFTPDTMPSPDTLRNMEDSWLDNNHEPAGALGGGGTNSSNGDDGGANFADDEGRMPALLDLMVKAMLVGFMMPLASGCWLLREEGIWTARWRMFVSLGMMVSILIGMTKAFAGEW